MRISFEAAAKDSQAVVANRIDREDDTMFVLCQAKEMGETVDFQAMERDVACLMHIDFALRILVRNVCTVSLKQ